MECKKFKIEVTLYMEDAKTEDEIKRRVSDLFFDLAHVDQIVNTNHDVKISTSKVVTSADALFIKGNKEVNLHAIK